MPASVKSIIEKTTIAAPGAFNAASALLIEKAGFDCVYISGAGLSNSSGVPDAGVLSLEEVLNLSSYIIKAVKIPAIVDVDTGFGGPAEVKKTAEAFERLGAGAIQIEDQEFPKRCGHLPGKTVIPAEEFIQKIKTATGARKSKDFLIIARTDARAVEGLDGAIRRANMYIEAGADIIFPEALESKDEFARFAREVEAPLMANMTEFGKTPYMTLYDFRNMGYSIVLFPMTCFRIAMKSMEDALVELNRNGTQKGLLERMQSRQEFYELIRYFDYR
ncbi:MAG: methylisocitrate lyase [Deltaproteobacteria bacterium]|nr:methylisocitrate lyase [Deltaproteobacteria bacterium]